MTCLDDSGQGKEVDYCFLCVCSFLLFITYLATTGLCCSCAGSLVVAYNFLVAACGAQSPDQGLNSSLLH